MPSSLLIFLPDSRPALTRTSRSRSEYANSGSRLLPLELVQRRLRQVDVAVLDERPHEAEQQREQQRCDVLAVDVGVGHQHDLVVPQLRDVEFVVDARAERGDDRLDFGVLQHTVDARLLDVDDLSAQRQDRLVHRVAAGLGRAACGVALHDVDLGLARIVGPAVGELARQATEVGGALAAHQFAGLTGGDAGLRRRHRLVHDGLRVGRVRLEPVRRGARCSPSGRTT